VVDQFAMPCRAILSFDAGITYPVMGTAAPIAAMVGAAPGNITIITFRATIAPRAAGHQGARRSQFGGRRSTRAVRRDGYVTCSEGYQSIWSIRTSTLLAMQFPDDLSV
jgi:hypothetical protein